VFRHCIHFSRRTCCVAAILMLLVGNGCAMFDREKWDLNRYRDERAVDIEKRLDATTPEVPNPF
jgi:hypothetical protein